MRSCTSTRYAVAAVSWAPDRPELSAVPAFSRAPWRPGVRSLARAAWRTGVRRGAHSLVHASWRAGVRRGVRSLVHASWRAGVRRGARSLVHAGWRAQLGARRSVLGACIRVLLERAPVVPGACTRSTGAYRRIWRSAPDISLFVSHESSANRPSEEIADGYPTDLWGNRPRSFSSPGCGLRLSACAEWGD